MAPLSSKRSKSNRRVHRVQRVNKTIVSGGDKQSTERKQVTLISVKFVDGGVFVRSVNNKSNDLHMTRAQSASIVGFVFIGNSVGVRSARFHHEAFA